jgi:hypothetical protein
MPAMATPKKPTADKQKRPRGPVVFVTLDAVTEASLVAFIEAQPVQPDRAAVGLTAIRDFLKRQGYFPTPPQP